jgi:hypothetical protein
MTNAYILQKLNSPPIKKSNRRNKMKKRITRMEMIIPFTEVFQAKLQF